MLAEIAETLRVLADPTRLRILHLLWRSEPDALRVTILQRALGLPQPTVSRHLAILRQVGLVRSDTVKTARLYRLAETQPPIHAAVLGALEQLVPDTPQAQHDLARLHDDPQTQALTRSDRYATNTLPTTTDGTDDAPASPEESTMSDLLHALSHPTRRQLLDLIAAAPGCTLADLCQRFSTSRVALSKHVGVLHRARLVVGMQQGRRRCLYRNAMPLQTLADRWSTRFTTPLARQVATIKRAVENPETSDG